MSKPEPYFGLFNCDGDDGGARGGDQREQRCAARNRTSCIGGHDCKVACISAGDARDGVRVASRSRNVHPILLPLECRCGRAAGSRGKGDRAANKDGLVRRLQCDRGEYPHKSRIRATVATRSRRVPRLDPIIKGGP